jgi:hypothetical protein
MHIRTLLLTLAAALLLGGCAKKPADKLVGEWKSTADGKPISFIFRLDRTAEVVIGNNVISRATANGKLEWRMDATRNPIVVNIVLAGPSGQSVTMPMIIRFITDRKLQVKIGIMGSQPAGFSAEDTHDQVVLDKQ